MFQDYTSFACPNPACSFYNRFSEGNIAHFSWTGKAKHIQRLYCKACRRRFSSRKGTLRERAKISEEQQVRLLKCFRWGVCDEGTADLAGVDVKTVHFFRDKAAKRAKIHHDNEAQKLSSSAVECDELYGKYREGKTWIGAAISVPSFLILSVVIGARNQALADRLLAEVGARCTSLGMILTDGWRQYWPAVIRVFGRLIRPRRKEEDRKLKPKKIDLKGAPFYGQVVKKTNQALALVAIECRALLGTLQECLDYLHIYEIGKVIHTTHIERWWGSLRCNVAALRRRSRCLSFTENTLKARVWIFVSLYNWILPHKTLSRKKAPTTPAMRAGLIDKILSYEEYIRKVVLPTGVIEDKVTKKLEQINEEEWRKAAQRTRPKPERQELWKAPSLAQKDEEVA